MTFLLIALGVLVSVYVLFMVVTFVASLFIAKSVSKDIDRLNDRFFR